MSENTLFLTTQGGVVFTPDAFEELRVYPEYFIQDCQSKVEECQQAHGILGDQSANRTPQQNILMRNVRDEIHRAETVIADLRQLQEGTQRIYIWNFVNLAEALHQTRLQLGLNRTEDDCTLYTVVMNMMAMLKSENPKFNESKFINYINNGKEVV